MAAELSEMNGTRQEIERHITDQAITQIVETGHETDGVLIAAGADWHSGVIGIAASRLVERFYRPSLVISLHEGVGKGSCRSIPGFNMYEALQYAKDELIQFGGHPMATLAEMKISILSVNAKVNDTKAVTIHMGISIKNLAQFEFIATKIRRLKDVYTVQRFTGGAV